MSTDTARPPADDRWAELLAPGGSVPPIAVLLGRHPDAPEMTQHLLDDLTLEKLVRIANVEHHRCRLSAIPDHLCEETRAQLAWDLLHSGMRDPELPDDTTLTRSARLLAESATGSPPLHQLRDASIHRLIMVCERLIALGAS